MTNEKELKPKEVAADLVMLALIPGLLAGIYFFVPISIQNQLALDYDNIQPHALFTAAYIHADTGHLLSNVTGYAVAVSYAYWLCLQTKRRQWFWRTMMTLLFVVPPVVNIANVVLFGTYFPEFNGLSRGFSGVVGAFGGFLFVALVAAVSEIYNGNLAQLVGMSLFLLLLVMLEVVYAGTIRPIVGGAVAVGIAVQLVGYFYQRDRSLSGIGFTGRNQVFQLGAGLLVIVVLAYLVFALFPSKLVQGGGFVNIFAHGIGTISGGVTAAGIYYKHKYTFI